MGREGKGEEEGDEARKERKRGMKRERMGRGRGR